MFQPATAWVLKLRKNPDRSDRAVIYLALGVVHVDRDYATACMLRTRSGRQCAGPILGPPLRV